MAKTTKSAKKTTTKRAKAKGRFAPEPSPPDLIRKPDITAFARVRFDCAIFVRVTHPDYRPHEVMALVHQGQVQMDPVAPGQVGTLILNGFPYTVLGYYTCLEQDAEYLDGPRECSFHGPPHDYHRETATAFQGMAKTTGEDFDGARRATRKPREHVAKRVAKKQKRAKLKKV
jgi:hypothetical protein